MSADQGINVAAVIEGRAVCARCSATTDHYSSSFFVFSCCHENSPGLGTERRSRGACLVFNPNETITREKRLLEKRMVATIVFPAQGMILRHSSFFQVVRFIFVESVSHHLSS